MWRLRIPATARSAGFACMGHQAVCWPLATLWSCHRVMTSQILAIQAVQTRMSGAVEEPACLALKKPRACMAAEASPTSSCMCMFRTVCSACDSADHAGRSLGRGYGALQADAFDGLSGHMIDCDVVCTRRMCAGEDEAVQGPASDQLQRAGLERRLQDLGSTEHRLQVSLSTSPPSACQACGAAVQLPSPAASGSCHSRACALA